MSPNPNREYGRSHNDKAECIIFGTLITIGNCSLLPLPKKDNAMKDDVIIT